MRAAVGAFPNQQAAAGLATVVVLAGLAVTGILLLPTLVSKTTQRNNLAEEAMLARMEEGLMAYVRLQQTIPGKTNWASAITSVSSVNARQVGYVYPQFSSDSTIQRVAVADNYLDTSPVLLPYTQSSSGLTGSQTNFLNSRARAMILSSTKRGLSVPVSTGFLSQQSFEAIWNWTYDPATKAPPTGWPTAWTGNGEFLHVRHIHFANLFQTLELENLQYSLNGSSLVSVTSGVTRYFLHGAKLNLHNLQGQIRETRVVRRNEAIRYPANTSSNNVYYLTGNGVPSDTDGIPTAQLTNVAPTSKTLPNYDPGRDAFAGLFIHKGGSDVSETDDTRIQKWITSTGSISIDNSVSLTLFTAMKDFRSDKGGQMTAFLVECDAKGGSPITIGTAKAAQNPWDSAKTGTWIESTFSFGKISWKISSTQRLGLFIIVNNDSDDDMWFAYGTGKLPSRLSLD